MFDRGSVPELMVGLLMAGVNLVKNGASTEVWMLEFGEPAWCLVKGPLGFWLSVSLLMEQGARDMGACVASGGSQSCH